MKRLTYIVIPVAFIALAFWQLLSIRPYILETAALTPFLTTQPFATAMLSAPCGPLFYVASFLQYCFALPFLGITLLVLVLSLLAILLWRACHIDSSLYPLCWLPSLLLLADYTQAGYLIYVLKTPALAFTLPLGLLLSVLMFLLWRKVSSLPLLALLSVAFLLFGYWTIGVCHFVAVAMIIVYEAVDCVRFRKFIRLGIALSLFVLSLFFPYILYRQGLIFVNLSDIYTVGIPDFSAEGAESAMRLPYILAFVVVALLPVLPSSPRRFPFLIFSLFVFAACGVYASTRTFRDANFLSTLRMKQSLVSSRYEEVLEEARLTDVEPTRLQVLLCRVALLRLGSLADECFTYPDGSAAYTCPRDIQILQKVGGSLAYSHFGVPNYAFRWAMEDMVEYGHRPDYLNMMHRCALLNGEHDVAMKYADLLASLPFGCNSGMSKAELSAIRRIMPTDDVLAEDDGIVEGFLLKLHSKPAQDNRQAIELSLMCNLIRKNSDAFWHLFDSWWKRCDDNRIPVHIQEACLLFGQMYGVDTTMLPLSDEIRQSYTDFLQQVRTNADDDYSRTALRPMFGTTYWYYYFYRDDLVTY